MRSEEGRDRSSLFQLLPLSFCGLNKMDLLFSPFLNFNLHKKPLLVLRKKYFFCLLLKEKKLYSNFVFFFAYSNGR